ncbi:hypothetical protein [Actinomadura rifamycini]|uniref:hypothetical protein n=1 Tax=Actinomadura rifamycini TaxID=31962 RepID=UPI000479418A|nr:hypothetical protein [Actinomadura rifamycini]
MVGPILAIVALAVFAVPLVLMLYFAARYAADLVPRRERDDRPRGARPAPPRARPRERPAPAPPGGRRAADGRRAPFGHASGCRLCGHSRIHHEPPERGGCTWRRPGWRHERVYRDDDWDTGWVDERRWHDGTPCGCAAYVGSGDD